MKRLLWPVIWLVAVALIAAGFSAVSGIIFWWAFLMLAGAILLNGWVATLEDDLPGGFNNPDGMRTPKYVVLTGWIVRGLGIILVILCFAAIGLHFFGAR